MVHGQHHGALGGRPPPPPVVVQQRPGPPQIPPQMQRPMAPPARAFPAHPPRGNIPPQSQRPVVVSDIRPEVQTEEDIREHLTDYIILRFEKVEPYDEYDSDGELRATWDKCIRRRLPDVDKADARREIRRLNREDKKKGKTWLEKQNSIGPKAQNQLAKAQRELSLEERDGRFHTVLAQIDFSLKPVVEKHEKVTRHRSNTKRKIRQKVKYERTSITAYFKRCPKENQIPSELARRIELDKQQSRQRQEQQDLEVMRQRQHQMQGQQMPPQRPQVPPQRPQVMPQPHPGPVPAPQVRQMNPPGPPPPLPPPPPPQHHHQQQAARMNRPQAMPMQQHGKAPVSSRPHTPIQVIHKHNRRDKRHKRGHSRGSDSSLDSDPGSYSEFGSDTTLFNELSRSSGSHKGKKDHGQRGRPLRYLANPKSFGAEIHSARRHGLGEKHSYIFKGSGQRSPVFQVPATPRKAAIPIENVGQLEADAYYTDQKAAEYRQRQAEAESLDTAARRYQPRYAPRPEVVLDRGSPGIRHVTPGEVGRQLDHDFQARLRLGRETRHHHGGLDCLVHGDEQRHRETVALEEQELIMRKFEEQEARERRRREAPRSLMNPFTPLSRRRTIWVRA